jgi:hypothetical protein
VAGYSVTIGGSVEESAKSQAPIAAVVLGKAVEV